MYFNSGTDQQSIVARMNRIAQAGNTVYPLIEKASDANSALDRYWALAITADGKWELDDINQTDQPSARATINVNQQDYSINTDMLIVEKVLVKDPAGNWHELTPVDLRQSRSELHAMNILELPTGNVGIPTHYDIRGNSIFLDAIPNYTQAASLRIIFKRGPSYFIASDTTKQPGIPLIHHGFIPRYGTLQYLIDKGNPRKNDLAVEVKEMEDAIQEYFGKRNENEPTKFVAKKRSSR